jgi:hypothetical protein
VNIWEHSHTDHAILPLHFVLGQDRLPRLVSGVAQMAGTVEGILIARAALGSLP